MKPRPSEMLPAVANIYSTFPCEVNDLKVTSLKLQILNVLIRLAKLNVHRFGLWKHPVCLECSPKKIYSLVVLLEFLRIV